MKIDFDTGNEDNSGDENKQDIDDVAERRRSSSDPVNLSLGYRERDEDSNDGHIDVETIGNAPSKVSFFHQSPPTAYRLTSMNTKIDNLLKIYRV